jgi:aryl-phospho-beta-D-glucosidase BglC (GH1 family)
MIRTSSFLLAITLLGLCAPARSQSTPNAASFWVEAESAAVIRPMIVRSDSTASGQIYLNTLSWSASTSSAPSDGHVTCNLDITEAGSYRIWIRTIAPTYGQNSYWLQLDSEAWSSWENIGPFSSWGWASHANLLSLDTGKHSVTLAYRDGGTKLDKILITKDLNYVPSGLGGQAEAAVPVTFSSDTVERYGALQVKSDRLCDAGGNPVQLKGLSTHGIQWYPFAPGSGIPLMAQLFGVDVVRIAMYVEATAPTDATDFWNGYMAHPAEMKDWLRSYVDAAIQAGVYVIIDWHIHNNPATFTQDALAFYSEMSQLYGTYPNVIYEICNEPFNGVEWSTIKDYATQVIAAIRQNDPDNLIIVGTPFYSQQVDLAANDPLQGVSNVMYTLHFYAASHREELRQRVLSAAPRIPIFVTEWGTSDYGVSWNDFTEAKIWLDFLDELGISSINWSFSNKDEASSVLLPGVSMNTAWTRSDLSASGQWLMDNYFSASDPPPAPTLSVTPASAAFSSSGGSAQIAVTASEAWTAGSSDSSWLTVSPGSGTGTNLTLTAAPNPSASPRSATVQVKLDSGLASASVTVSQAATQSQTGVITAQGKVAAGSGPWYTENQLIVQSTAPVSALTLTVNVARTQDASVNGSYDTTGVFDHSTATTDSSLIYTFSLKPGAALPVGTATLTSQISLKGTFHPTTGDSWTLVYTSGESTETLSGGF